MGVFFRRASRYVTWSDLGILLWVAFCAVLALSIGEQVRRLDRYGTTIDQSADALDETASALQLVARAPLVGAAVGDVAAEISATAASMRESAAHTRSAAQDLSVLLTIAMIVLPTAPALAIYLPHRISEINRNRELLRSVQRSRNAEFLRNYLANRALIELPYDALQEMGQDPWSQVRQGKVRGLVLSELRKLGLEGEIAVHDVVADEEAAR